MNQDLFRPATIENLLEVHSAQKSGTVPPKVGWLANLPTLRICLFRGIYGAEINRVQISGEQRDIVTHMLQFFWEI